MASILFPSSRAYEHSLEFTAETLVEAYPFSHYSFSPFFLSFCVFPFSLLQPPRSVCFPTLRISHAHLSLFSRFVNVFRLTMRIPKGNRHMQRSTRDHTHMLQKKPQNNNKKRKHTHMNANIAFVVSSLSSNLIPLNRIRILTILSWLIFDWKTFSVMDTYFPFIIQPISRTWNVYKKCYDMIYLHGEASQIMSLLVLK